MLCSHLRTPGFFWPNVFWIVLLVMLSALPARAEIPAEEQTPDFLQGATLKSVSAIDVLPQWKRILTDYYQNLENDKTCAYAPQTCSSKPVQLWQKFIAGIAYQPPLQKIQSVNGWINRWPYKQDNWIYNKADYWADIHEFLQLSGDCEDFAIAKYLTLRQLGIPAESMWIAIAYDIYSGTDHAFLIVRYDGQTLVLESRDNTIKAENHSRRYRPHFLFNEKNVWVFEKPVMASTIREGQDNAIPANR